MLNEKRIRRRADMIIIIIISLRRVAPIARVADRQRVLARQRVHCESLERAASARASWTL